MLASSYFRSAVSSLVCKVPALLTAINIHTSDATGKITIYDGQDALSGRQWGVLASPSSVPYLFPFHTPILLESGIYVAVTATVASYTICFIPLRGNSPYQPYTPNFIMTGMLQNG